jgi:hypothetical protein
LEVQRCASCGLCLHPPDVLCPRCNSTDLRYAAVSGEATLYSFTQYHNTGVEGFSPITGVASLVEQETLLLPFVFGDEVEVSRLKIGSRLRVEFEHVAEEGIWIPQFVLAT